MKCLGLFKKFSLFNFVKLESSPMNINNVKPTKQKLVSTSTKTLLQYLLNYLIERRVKNQKTSKHFFNKRPSFATNMALLFLITERIVLLVTLKIYLFFLELTI